MKAAGVALVCREALPLQDAPIGRGPSIDILGYYLTASLRALAGTGADLSGPIAITIGQDHPSFLAGQTVIEAKAARAKVFHDDGGDCPVDHSEAEAVE